MTAKLAALKRALREDAQVDHRVRAAQLEETQSSTRTRDPDGDGAQRVGLSQPCEGPR